MSLDILTSRSTSKRAAGEAAMRHTDRFDPADRRSFSLRAKDVLHV
jgi:hypothetical protein